MEWSYLLFGMGMGVALRMGGASARKRAPHPPATTRKGGMSVTPGTAPAANPFVGSPRARPEIWSLGHRNVLGAALDAKNRLWVAEMGPRGGDELNLIEPGKDYGWPTIGYGEEYSGEALHTSTQAPGLQQPIYYLDPVISPGALSIYNGDLFPEWKGNFFIAGTPTRIYCRPICPARSPKDENTRYSPTAAAAHAAGFRPCLRCRPEASPGTPAWLGTSGGDGFVFLLTAAELRR